MMTGVFYCKNENDLKKVAMYIFESELECNSFEDAIEYSKIYSCKYKPEGSECCLDCEDDLCGLYDKLDEVKDIYKNIEVWELEEDYPMIVIYDSDIDGTVKYISIAEAKENTKYGTLVG